MKGAPSDWISYRYRGSFLSREGIEYPDWNDKEGYGRNWIMGMIKENDDGEGLNSSFSILDWKEDWINPLFVYI